MKKGFSLIELLVSLVIISIVVVFISAFVLNLRDEKGQLVIDVPYYINQASISKTLNFDAKENGISNVATSNNGKTCTINYGGNSVGVININTSGDTLTYTYNSNVKLVKTLDGKTFTSIEVPAGYPKTYGDKKLYKYVIHVSNAEDIEIVNYSGSVPATIVALPGVDSDTGLPVVRIGTEEFYNITNVISYSSLVSENGNIYNYASDKTILLAKYNLYVGKRDDGAGHTIIIASSDAGYGLQNANAKGLVSGYLTVGTVPFCGSSTSTGYWYQQGGIKPQYGLSGVQSNIYDVNHNSAPNWDEAFNNSSTNSNYSVAYYVEEYVRRLGVTATGRLLTYSEADALTVAQRTNNSKYWIASLPGTATNPSPSAYQCVLNVDENGTLVTNSCFYMWIQTHNGIRPVIVVNTSDIQS